MRSTLLLLVVLALIITFSYATPLPEPADFPYVLPSDPDTDDSNSTTSSTSRVQGNTTTTDDDDLPLNDPQPITSLGLRLRILPLGASITLGIASTNLNGYRFPLQNLLSGVDIDYVGSLRNGSFENNHHEGHPGAVIHQVTQFAKLSLPSRPNVVLIHVGTNDMIPSPAPAGLPYAGAPARLGSQLDEIWGTCPDAVVLVARILPARDSKVNARIATFNQGVDSLVANRTRAGRKVATVDFFNKVPVSLISKDGIHPTDEGYESMARLWVDGIWGVLTKGWVGDPVDV